MRLIKVFYTPISKKDLTRPRHPGIMLLWGSVPDFRRPPIVSRETLKISVDIDLDMLYNESSDQNFGAKSVPCFHMAHLVSILDQYLPNFYLETNTSAPIPANDLLPSGIFHAGFYRNPCILLYRKSQIS